jgi:hypothetical protein
MLGKHHDPTHRILNGILIFGEVMMAVPADRHAWAASLIHGLVIDRTA